MRRTVFAEGEFYHLYNRGVEKRSIFTDPDEYKRFLAYLLVLNSEEPVRIDNVMRAARAIHEKPSRPLVALGAFCLMPNHFHLYATPVVEGGISKFMQRLQTAHTMYFNEKHERSGVLFQGAFKAEHVHNDRYARYLFSYIHLNPAKLFDPGWKERGAFDLKKLRTQVRTYPYSSMGEYIAGQHIITNPDFFPKYLTSLRDIDTHVDNWLEFRVNSPNEGG